MDEWIKELEENLDLINRSIGSLKDIAAGTPSRVHVSRLQQHNGDLSLAPLLLAKANTVHALVDAYIWQSNRDVEDAKKDAPVTRVIVGDQVVENSECTECGEPIAKWKRADDTYYWMHDERIYKTATHDPQP